MKPNSPKEYYHKGSIDILTSVINSLENDEVMGADLSLRDVIEMMQMIKVSIEAKVSIKKSMPKK